ncbi:MAG: pyridoxal 5'-phosphate synthase glutaminase subunit PdxT [Chloroflexi bacterium]|nr:pyridoxal 5'-phosphate synthase glutaminase subunit PdxT [Chloroflexota bacterium]
MEVGVLAVQGDFAEHIVVLGKLGVQAREVRLPEHLDSLDGLIIPGGESTTLSRLMTIYNLREPVARMAEQGRAVWGTCAGMIMLAQEITEKDPIPLGVMDIGVQRNAFGRQVDSFEATLEIAALGARSFPAVFIRAPRITKVGNDVRVLARLADGTVAAARQGTLLATTFHPELTDDSRFHEYFLDMAAGEGNASAPSHDGVAAPRQSASRV